MTTTTTTTNPFRQDDVELTAVQDRTTGEWLDPNLREVAVDSDGVHHGDAFCYEFARGETATSYVTIAERDPMPTPACPVCVDDVLHPLAETGGRKRPGPNGPSVDAPERNGDGTGSGQNTGNRATEKQVAYIESMLAQLPADERELHLSQDPTRLDKRTASELIDTLRGAAQAATADAAEAAMTMDEFGKIADRLDRKFSPDDLTADLSAFATRYATDYEGDFAFMVDMADAARKGSLSPGQAKGVLNCARADWNRSKDDDGDDTPDIPAGRYGVHADDDGHVVLYKVDRPDKGRWAGYTFVSQLIGGPHGDYAEQRIDRGHANSVLAKIAEAGPLAAAQLYGHTAARCSICNRSLSDEGSIERGIGPVCAARFG